MPIRFWLVTAGALLAVLFGLGWAFELGPEPEVIVDGPLELPSRPLTAFERDDREAAAETIRFTPELHIEGPTTLRIVLERDRTPGWVGVACALVHRESGEIRELSLGTTWRPEAVGDPGRLHAEALVDRVASGTYVIRLEPAWEPVTEAPAPAGQESADEAVAPHATLRVVRGARSSTVLLLAAGLILLPALVAVGRWLWYERRRRRVLGPERSAEAVA